ncbi:hypothetical protein pb186bvf_005580 [Paramecium bursaria]
MTFKKSNSENNNYFLSIFQFFIYHFSFNAGVGSFNDSIQMFF